VNLYGSIYLAIPKQALFLWFVFKIVFLLVNGCYVGFLLVVVNVHVFCHNCIESREHIFFEFGFSNHVWWTLIWENVVLSFLWLCGRISWLLVQGIGEVRVWLLLCASFLGVLLFTTCGD
jgi:hypothetical protein